MRGLQVKRFFSYCELYDVYCSCMLFFSGEATSFKQVMRHDEQGGNTTKPVKDFVAWLGGEVNVAAHVEN